jgi:hypothetical protein
MLATDGFFLRARTSSSVSIAEKPLNTTLYSFVTWARLTVARTSACFVSR